MYKFDWSFVDDLYKLYGIKSVYDKTDHNKSVILINSFMFAKVVTGSKRKGIKVAEMPDLIARYLFLKREHQ